MSDEAPGLFEGAPSPKIKVVKAPKAPKPEPDGTVLRLEAAFVAAHERRWGCRPLIAYARDRKHLKDLAAQLGEADVLDLIDRFFVSVDFQVTRSSYTIADFFRLAPRLRLRGRPPADPRTAANLDAAARATGRKGIE